MPRMACFPPRRRPAPLAHVVTIHEVSRMTGQSRFTGTGSTRKSIAEVRPEERLAAGQAARGQHVTAPANRAPLRDVQRIVVDDEARLERDVLGSRELQGDGLADEAGQAEGVLAVPGVAVEVASGRPLLTARSPAPHS